MSIMFNEICINEEMLPKYTYFKLHDPAAHTYNSTLEYRRVVDPPLMMAQNRAESTRDTCNYGQYIYIYIYILALLIYFIYIYLYI